MSSAMNDSDCCESMSQDSVVKSCEQLSLTESDSSTSCAGIVDSNCCIETPCFETHNYRSPAQVDYSVKSC